MTQRTPAQPNNTPQKTSLPDVDPFIKPTPQLDTLTAYGVVQLQRVIGNKGVQRLMTSQIPARRRVQRTDDEGANSKPKNDDNDEGLIEQGSSSRFAQAVQSYAQNNKTGYLGPLKTEMMKSINAELKALGVPETSLAAQKPSSVGGDVRTTDWKIMVDMGAIFGEEALRISDVSSGQIAQAAAVVYKQARRLEQYYRIAQLNVSELRKENWTDELIVTHLMHLLNVPEDVIRAAISDPLKSDIDPDLLEKIKAWAESLYGSSKDYRELIDELRGITNILLSTLANIFNLVPANYDTLDPQQQLTIQTLLKPHLVYLETYFKEFSTSRDLNLIPLLELMEDRNAAEQSDERTMIISHLTKLLDVGNIIPTFSQFPVIPSRLVKVMTPIKQPLEDISKELIVARNDLPEQRDMQQAAGEVRKAVKREFIKNP